MNKLSLLVCLTIFSSSIFAKDFGSQIKDYLGFGEEKSAAAPDILSLNMRTHGENGNLNEINVRENVEKREEIINSIISKKKFGALNSCLVNKPSVPILDLNDKGFFSSPNNIHADFKVNPNFYYQSKYKAFSLNYTLYKESTEDLLNRNCTGIDKIIFMENKIVKFNDIPHQKVDTGFGMIRCYEVNYDITKAFDQSKSDVVEDPELIKEFVRIGIKSAQRDVLTAKNQLLSHTVEKFSRTKQIEILNQAQYDDVADWLCSCDPFFSTELMDQVRDSISNHQYIKTMDKKRNIKMLNKEELKKRCDRPTA